jgi:hypothetical protein
VDLGLPAAARQLFQRAAPIVQPALIYKLDGNIRETAPRRVGIASMILRS